MPGSPSLPPGELRPEPNCRIVPQPASSDPADAIGLSKIEGVHAVLHPSASGSAEGNACTGPATGEREAEPDFLRTFTVAGAARHKLGRPLNNRIEAAPKVCPFPVVRLAAARFREA
jgi:hypothetical protein